MAVGNERAIGRSMHVTTSKVGSGPPSRQPASRQTRLDARGSQALEVTFAPEAMQMACMEARPSGLRVAMAALAILAMSCASADHRASARCEVGDIQAVFASPLDYQGKRFCGEGFWYAGDEYGGIYDRPVTSDEQRYDIVFALVAGSGRSFDIPDRQNTRVLISGAIDADDCNPPDEPGEGCVPFRRAIYLENWELRIADD